MAPPPAAAGEEDLLEVACAGCGETLEVERGLTEFICPDCSTPQALPPELMPPPPPRRRALPIPARSGPASPPAPAGAGAARLPCGSCGAMLGVPPGLSRCGCPVCGAELAVDPARLRHYLLSTAAAPLVPVSLPPVFRALEGRQDYPDSAVRVGHIQGHPMGHLEQSQDRHQNTQALLEFPDAGTDSDDIDTGMSNGINETPCCRNGFPVAARTVGAKGRQLETLNYVTCQAQAQQSGHSVHAEHPSDHTIHVGEAQNESANHAIHRGLGHMEPIKEKTVIRHSNQVTGTAIGPKSVSVEKRQVQSLRQIAQDRQQKTRPPNLPSPIEQDPEHSNDNIQAEHDEAETGQLTPRLARKSMKRNLTSSNKGFGHRRSKRLSKQSAASTYYESPENESEESEPVSPSRTMSDSQDIDRLSNDISSNSLPQHNMPHRRSNEANNLRATTKSDISSSSLRQHNMPHRRSNEVDNLQATRKSASIPDISDPESFARYYSKTYPPEVRRALERNLNLMHIGGKEKRKRGDRGPNLCLNVWTMPEGARIRVSFNDQGQPIGDEARTLSSFLGQIARDGTVAPVTYTDWRFFPEKNKKAMMHLMNMLPMRTSLRPFGAVFKRSKKGCSNFYFELAGDHTERCIKSSKSAVCPNQLAFQTLS